MGPSGRAALRRRYPGRDNLSRTETRHGAMKKDDLERLDDLQERITELRGYL